MMRRLLIAVLAATALLLAWIAAWLVADRGWHPLAATLAVAIVPPAYIALLLAAQFSIGAWQRRVWRPDLNFGWLESVRAWAGEFPVTIRTFLYAQIRYADRRLPSAARAERVPVLLVHGYVCNRGIWWSFAGRLARRGHPVDSVNLEPVFGSIDDYAPIVAAGVQRLREATGAERIAIVAHSMGGLAARAYLARHGHDGVAALVTLGSPHRGTWLAHLGHGRNVHQMLPGSDWLRALAARESPAVRAMTTTVYTHHDNVVMPQAVQTLEGAHVVSFRAVGHVQLVYDARVQARVEQALDACDAKRPTAAARESAGAVVAPQAACD